MGKKRGLLNCSKAGFQGEVLKFPPTRENRKRFIPYCNNLAQQGIALKPEVCNSRKCLHYHELIISETTRVYKSKQALFGWFIGKTKGCIIRNGTRLAKRTGKKGLFHSLEDELQCEVLKICPTINNGARFIPYCDYTAHQGINKRTWVCHLRKCIHYYRLPISKSNQVYKTKKA